MANQKGVTLIEILISLAIVAIIMTAVAPSIQSILIKNKIASQINELSAVIQFARNNSIDQQISTVVCPSSDYSVCSNDWDAPKIVFIDIDGNGDRGSDEELIATTEAISPNNYVTGPANSLMFLPNGEASGNYTLLICHTDKEAEYARQITITLQGRVKMSTDSDRNGIHEDTTGTELSCP
ncbi:MAG: GspH/FimT family pseudopilin [Paraglaciecola sp.]|uniref:GspH/FimT family pseudopilin n=1 Tax=Pseudomonadati TaxID=3379134 RepID=UPI0027401394|nr:GspH/FimT family pseudopilin [Paraglaciecola sp.]MDP5031479.1 GspH/FimT family pseudopilin [Paraglaciecola sp.]MDP5041178.1 GspH/FimT family pseudopilin [Paraglaciecola sp.]MDP5130824.1 GspH/FimT family pseudopilin [Paraglaciecola sp.]